MTGTRIDRAALVRRAMVEMVADKGIHGTSMSQIAERAGVGTGTAYVHYRSKEDLLIAAFVEVKTMLGEAASKDVDASLGPRAIFELVWRNSFGYLQADPAIAEFLLQVEASPLRTIAHDAMAEGSTFSEIAGRLSSHLVDLPAEILYDLGLAPVVRLVAFGTPLSDSQIDTLVESSWRAVHRLPSED